MSLGYIKIIYGLIMIAEKILGQPKQKILLQEEASFSYLNMIKSVKKQEKILYFINTQKINFKNKYS